LVLGWTAKVAYFTMVEDSGLILLKYKESELSQAECT